MSTVECVFGDWSFDLSDEPVVAHRPGASLPLMWQGWQVTEMPPDTPLTDMAAAAQAALAGHWGKAHPSLFRAIAGDFVLDYV